MYNIGDVSTVGQLYLPILYNIMTSKFREFITAWSTSKNKTMKVLTSGKFASYLKWTCTGSVCNMLIIFTEFCICGELPPNCKKSFICAIIDIYSVIF